MCYVVVIVLNPESHVHFSCLCDILNYHVLCAVSQELTSHVCVACPTTCVLHGLSKKRVLRMVTDAHVLVGGGISESILESVPWCAKRKTKF